MHSLPVGNVLIVKEPTAVAEQENTAVQVTSCNKFACFHFELELTAAAAAAVVVVVVVVANVCCRCTTKLVLTHTEFVYWQIC